MRAAYITGYGDNSVVTSGEVGDPVPGADEALIEVRSGWKSRRDRHAPRSVPCRLSIHLSAGVGLRRRGRCCLRALGRGVQGR